MIYQFIACLVLAAISVSVVESLGIRFRPTNDNVEVLGFKEKNFTQYIDHFNYGGQAGPDGQFQQRYLINDQFWKKPQGPVFFYTGNEGAITAFWNASGFVHQLAEAHKALIIFAEHRYYGTSLPFGEIKSFQVDHIGFLNMEQALADYAVLLKALGKVYGFENSKTVAFGGSYGGMLSGYMRYKYPHIITAAVASSAPFYTIAGNRPRSEFFQAVTNTFRKADQNCPINVQAGFSKINDLIASGPTGVEKVKEAFNVCSFAAMPKLREKALAVSSVGGGVQGWEQVKRLYEWIRNAFTTMAMMDYPYPTSLLAPLPGYPVNVACKYLASAQDKLEGLAKATFLVYGSKVKCHDLYKEFIECADPTGCGLGNDALAWDYQACTEMILPGGSTNVTDMFPKIPWTLEYREAYCHNRWGLGKSRLSWVSTQFWGVANDIRKASNIIFPNGDLDPWMPGGVLQDLSPTLKAVLVKGGAHHLDLRTPNPADPYTVTLARLQIDGFIKQVLHEVKRQ